MEPDVTERSIASLQSIPGFDCLEGIERIFGNRTLYYKLTVLFFKSEHLSGLGHALQQNDAARTAGEAHALRGAALNMGFTRIAELAEMIHVSSRNGLSERAYSCFKELEAIFSHAVQVAHLNDPD